MDLRPFTILSLCAGVGGLDLGLRVAQPNARTVCFVEIEAYAAAILATRMEQDTLDQAPIWTDLRTFDGKPWCGLVDCITAGYPCQPFSVAGKQLGDKDPRHLWPDVFRVVREIDPPLCFFENVPGHLRLGCQQVHDDLRSLGYRVKAGLFTAEEVGASHKRERLFILAYRESVFSERAITERDCTRRPPQTAGGFGDDLGNAEHNGSSTAAFTRGDGTDAGAIWSASGTDTSQQPAGTDILADTACAENLIGEYRNVATTPAGGTGFNTAPGDGGSDVAYTTGAGNGGKTGNLSQAQWGQDGSLLRLPDSASQIVADGDYAGCQKQCGAEPIQAEHPTIECGGLSALALFAPGPTGEWDSVPEGLEPAICRMADGLAYRVDRLRAGGNGVVPLAAAYAWRTLISRAKTSIHGEPNQ